MAGSRHHDQSDLAEVAPIRPGTDSQDPRPSGMMRRIAQAFAPLRTQPATRVTPPRPPSPAASSPASQQGCSPLRTPTPTLAVVPDDAA